jgi:hypothetical protein
MSVSIRDRVGAATGAAYVVLIFVGNMMNTAGTSQSTHPTGEQVLADVAHQASSTTAKIGMTLEVLGFVAFIAFVGYLIDVLGRRGAQRAGWVAGGAVVAAVTMLAIKLGSAAPYLALFIDRDHLSPEMAQVLNDVNGGAFVLSWLPCACFVLGIAYALWRAELVGRPTAYIGGLLGAAGIVLAFVGLMDPLGANPLAFLFGLLWLAAVSVRLAVRPGVADDVVQPGSRPAVAVGA